MNNTIIESLKKGDLVMIKTKLRNNGMKDESYKVHTGIVSYISDTLIGFSKASSLHIYTNGKTYGGDKMQGCFSISRATIESIT